MTLKEQALEHWRENKRRLKAMDWKEWCNMNGRLRRYEVLEASSSYAPQISSRRCPFCLHYVEQCHVINRDMTRDRCPLYDGAGPGGCCKEWQDVRDALMYPVTKRAAMGATKKVAMGAINRMIERLEAINEQEINTNTKD